MNITVHLFFFVLNLAHTRNYILNVDPKKFAILIVDYIRTAILNVDPNVRHIKC